MRRFLILWLFFVILLAIVFARLLLFTATDWPIKYQQIQHGMNLDQIQAIIGFPDADYYQTSAPFGKYETSIRLLQQSGLTLEELPEAWWHSTNEDCYLFVPNQFLIAFFAIASRKSGKGGSDVTDDIRKPFAGTLWISSPTR